MVLRSAQAPSCEHLKPVSRAAFSDSALSKYASSSASSLATFQDLLLLSSLLISFCCWCNSAFSLWHGPLDWTCSFALSRPTSLWGPLSSLPSLLWGSLGWDHQSNQSPESPTTRFWEILKGFGADMVGGGFPFCSPFYSFFLFSFLFFSFFALSRFALFSSQLTDEMGNFSPTLFAQRRWELPRNPAVLQCSMTVIWLRHCLAWRTCDYSTLMNSAQTM